MSVTQKRKSRSIRTPPGSLHVWAIAEAAHLLGPGEAVGEAVTRFHLGDDVCAAKSRLHPKGMVLQE